MYARCKNLISWTLQSGSEQGCSLIFVWTVNSQLLSWPYHCNYGSRLVLHWYVKSEASIQMRTFMNYSAHWKSKEVLTSTSDFTHLTCRQNGVVIVSSVIAKIFNPSKCWTVIIKLLLSDTLFNQCLLLFIVSYLLFNFISVFFWYSAYCSIQFFSSVFILFGICSVLILEMCSRYFDHVSIKHQAVNKHQTPDSVIFCLSIGASGLLQS